MKDPTRELSRRERQIMDVVYRRGRATAAEIREGIPDPPSYSAVRASVRTLEQKGHLEHVQEGPRYVYLPTRARSEARTSALAHLVDTFFEGSTAGAVAALLDLDDGSLSEEDAARLRKLIDKAREEGR